MIFVFILYGSPFNIIISCCLEFFCWLCVQFVSISCKISLFLCNPFFKYCIGIYFFQSTNFGTLWFPFVWSSSVFSFSLGFIILFWGDYVFFFSVMNFNVHPAVDRQESLYDIFLICQDIELYHMNCSRQCSRCTQEAHIIFISSNWSFYYA